ncbi:MAG TPA: single-stranded-DNA-specific exonuclease RecJ [Limnochordia bacterium]|nr:single-stranded-DNA-specific exonuclease RecJ [Limnochordia bacterium]
MGSKRKKWILRGQDTPLAAHLAQALGIRPVVAQILLNRGISTVEAGRQFFDCDLMETPDPFLMLGMDKAVARVQQALTEKESIVVYGDYDADGQTATALLVASLREVAILPAAITYYLPDRVDEGYGLNHDAIAHLAKRASLLITVDCGISSIAEIDYAQSLGLDVIVTDHHEPGPVLPSAVAILNPKQEGCNYPFKHLAGVGVACKLVQGLGAPHWKEHLDLVALGTVADLVPLEGENRTLVSQGLRTLTETKKLGLAALQKVAEVTKPAASDLGFRLAPRLNAAGRLGDSSRGVRLLLTEDEAEARELAAELHQENAARQELEAGVLAEAIGVVDNYRLQERSSLVVWGENWHQGVVGIVASRLVERYYLPTIVVSISGEQATASARSISGFDMYQALSECEELLSKFGGHTMAAGLSLPTENLLSFQRRFEEVCQRKISPDDYIPKLYVDDTISLGQVSAQLIKELGELEPHGYGNPGPLLQAEVSVVQTRTVGAEGSHLQLTVGDETADQMAAIAFGFGDQQEEIERNAERLALAFVPGVNEWRNEKTLQLAVRDWEPRARNNTYVKKWMIDHYPWRLGASYYQSRALHLETTGMRDSKANWVDLRGTWDKAEALQNRQRGLILVNTPAEVLGVCRELRIKIAKGDQLIGFEHEWLTDGEREELSMESPTWLVSTGFGLEGSKWPFVIFWEPPLTEEAGLLWANLCQPGGEVVAVYGPKDIRALQGDLAQYYLDRQGLARLYTALRKDGREISLVAAYQMLESMGMLGALPVALGVFSELGLWAVDEKRIVYNAAPEQKLDLHQSVLYNKVIKMRQQSAQYLKRCLERGFFQNGLKSEN